ncbi:MAG: cation transporter, partial [Mobilitalea sp.]
MEKSEKTAFVAIVINCFLFGIKAVAAFTTGSIAIKAEAFHTFSDFIASLTVLVGLKIAKRKTKTFPYGLYKIENLMSVIIS